MIPASQTEKLRSARLRNLLRVKQQLIKGAAKGTARTTESRARVPPPLLWEEGEEDRAQHQAQQLLAPDGSGGGEKAGGCCD